MTQKHPSLRTARIVRNTVAVIALSAAAVGGSVASATAAPGAATGAAASPALRADALLPASPFDLALSGGNPDFGFRKQGTVVTQEFSVMNTGFNDITIDPAPLSMLSGVFNTLSIGFSSTDIIRHNSVAAFVVAYTVPAAGTHSSATVNLVATDRTDGASKTLAITFDGKSLATDPAHFAVATEVTHGGTAYFDATKVGDSETQLVELKVDGVIPLRFDEGNLIVVDSNGEPLIPDVDIADSTFGSAGSTYKPGETATFHLRFRPTHSGEFKGKVLIVAHQVSGVPEQPSVIEELPFYGKIDAPTPTPTSTPTSTPAPTSTTPGSATGTGSGSTPSSTSSRQLASTGLTPEAPVLVAGIVVLAGTAATAFGLRHRRRTRRS